MKIKETQNLDSSIYQDAIAIRKSVFITEQGVPVDLELDDKDKLCHHLVLYDQEKALATARLLPLSSTSVRLQRMAVVMDFRAQGYGKQLLQACLDLARERGFKSLEAHAQLTALPFYQRLGFDSIGLPFDEVGIPHIHVQIRLD